MQNQLVVLQKVINCIDSTGTEVEIGSFFTTEDENGNHQTTECLGDYFKAKKTVLQWTKCTLPSGAKVTEGNFHVQLLTPKTTSNKPALQKGEILSCIRNGKEVGLKCTGCVSEHTSVHVGVSGYVEVQGQWTQCRRTKDGCRLINVTRNYVDCQLQGSSATYQNGIYFNDTNGISTYYCNHGVVSKQGCTIDGQWALVGEVVYSSNGEAFLCDSSSTYSSFNGLKGCILPDGSVKRFQEIWKDEDVMKRCYWKNGPSGPSEDVIISYACIRGEEIFPENKIIQRENGIYEKCVRGFDGELGFRKLNDKELKEFIKRKTLRLDLSEYYANGGKGNIERFADAPLSPSPSPSSSPSASADATPTTPSTETSTNAAATDSSSPPSTSIASSSTSSSTISAKKSQESPASEPSFPPMDDIMKESLTVSEATQVTINNNSPSSTASSSTLRTNESCIDLVPFCSQISSYCPDFDRYQMIDGETGAGKDTISSAIIELQDLVSGNLGKDKNGHRPISPCEARMFF
uniref:Uncharacterized protein n=1 Tax=Panagrolaimus superbus TaxID=310955 RepID=A0A914XVH5_9BILA